MTIMKRDILGSDKREATVQLLQSRLVDLIDLGLQGKQAHWNLVGEHFRTRHLQLDEIIEQARNASDEIAERMAALSEPADGRAGTVATASNLATFPEGFHDANEVISLIADRMATAVEGLRMAIDKLETLDPISQDLLIEISGKLEKSLWMVQAQEVSL